jgi:hypothetical protein
MRIALFVPAILAAVTDGITAVIVGTTQPYPCRLVAFQVVMLVAALLVAAPIRWMRFFALVPLHAGVLLAGFSVGFLYIPTVISAWWVAFQRHRDSVAGEDEGVACRKR